MQAAQLLVNCGDCFSHRMQFGMLALDQMLYFKKNIRLLSRTLIVALKLAVKTQTRLLTEGWHFHLQKPHVSWLVERVEWTC